LLFPSYISFISPMPLPSPFNVILSFHFDHKPFEIFFTILHNITEYRCRCFAEKQMLCNSSVVQRLSSFHVKYGLQLCSTWIGILNVTSSTSKTAYMEIELNFYIARENSRTKNYISRKYTSKQVTALHCYDYY
jgi:hypothetical protein